MGKFFHKPDLRLCFMFILLMLSVFLWNKEATARSNAEISRDRYKTFAQEVMVFDLKVIMLGESFKGEGVEFASKFDPESLIARHRVCTEMYLIMRTNDREPKWYMRGANVLIETTSPDCAPASSKVR